MATPIKTKESFGAASVTVIRPEPGDEVPPALNLIISFEDALKLHFSLGQALAKLNGYNRATTAGKRSAVNLCLYTKKKRITVNEGQLPKTSSLATPDTGSNVGHLEMVKKLIAHQNKTKGNQEEQ